VEKSSVSRLLSPDDIAEDSIGNQNITVDQHMAGRGIRLTPFARFVHTVDNSKVQDKT